MPAIRQVLVTRISPNGASVEVRLLDDLTLELAVNGPTRYAGLRVAFPVGVSEGDPLVEDMLRLTAARVLWAHGR